MLSLVAFNPHKDWNVKTYVGGFMGTYAQDLDEWQSASAPLLLCIIQPHDVKSLEKITGLGFNNSLSDEFMLKSVFTVFSDLWWFFVESLWLVFPLRVS